MTYTTTINSVTICGNTIDELLLDIQRLYSKDEPDVYVEEIKKHIQALDPSMPIILEENDNQSILAHLEYGRHHNTPYHKISYKPSYVYWHHAVVHELMHLEMYIRATQCGKGVVFKKGIQNELYFTRNFGVAFKKFLPRIGPDGVIELQKMIQDGIITQLLSCPLDLFVEQRIFDRYKNMSALQLRSLLSQEKINIGQHNDSTVKQMPPRIVSANKVMCLATSLHLQDLYHLDFTKEYHPTKQELETARDLYEEFKAYLNTYADSDEYELFDYFAERVNLAGIVNKVNE